MLKDSALFCASSFCVLPNNIYYLDQFTSLSDISSCLRCLLSLSSSCRCNTALALLLLMKVQHINSALLQDPYLTNELFTINLTAIVVFGIFVLYFEARSLLKMPIWNVSRFPSLAGTIPFVQPWMILCACSVWSGITLSHAGLSEQVKTYMRAILRARLLLELNWRTPPLVVRLL